MAPNGQRKVSSLLDALDQTFMPSSSPATPTPPLQTQGNLRDFFAPTGGASSSKNAEKEALTRAQALQKAGMFGAGELAETEPSFMAKSKPTVGEAYFINDFANTSQSSNGPLLGNFSIRYDDETPVRSIDVGGSDQEQR